ncbi:MAG: hypothetical protein HOW97_01590 [Catenulispora sp.]|nr:hypothetical protein [Catenulispora sp.]
MSDHSEFEDRIREVLGDADLRPVSASAVIAGAKRRRTRRRATAAGSSLAVLGVLGVAVGAVALSGGSRPDRITVSPVTATTEPTTVTNSSSATCSGSLPVTSPFRDVSTDSDGLEWETFAGNAAGNPWEIQVHVFPDVASYVKSWGNKAPRSMSPGAIAALHPGPQAVMRTPGSTLWGSTSPDLEDAPRYFLGGGGQGLGPASPGQPPTYPAYLVSGWTIPAVDHVCLQYAHRAEAVSIYKEVGASLLFLGVVVADQPQVLIAYDIHGREIGREKPGLIDPDGTFVFKPAG